MLFLLVLGTVTFGLCGTGGTESPFVGDLVVASMFELEPFG